VASHKASVSDAPFGLLAALARRASRRLFNALRALGPRFARNDNHINQRFPREPLVAGGTYRLMCLPLPDRGQAPVESQRDMADTAKIDARMAIMERRHDF
jgi:hypothetical protein